MGRTVKPEEEKDSKANKEKMAWHIKASLKRETTENPRREREPQAVEAIQSLLRPFNIIGIPVEFYGGFCGGSSWPAHERVRE